MHLPILKIRVLMALFLALCLTGVAQVTDKEWQAKAIEKYPALGVKGSEFNTRFLNAYSERQKTDPAFFADARWPLILADELAASPPVTIQPSPTPPAPSTPAPDSLPDVAPRAESPPSTESHPQRTFPAIGVSLLIGGLSLCFLGVAAIIVFGSLANARHSAQASRSSESNLEETLWVGNPSHWNYIGRWLFGLLLSVVGLGLLVIAGIFLDRARRVYIVTNRKVIFQSGLLARSTNEVRIKDVRSINVSKQGVAGILGVGSVEFSSAASDRAEIIFANIAEADRVRDLVREIQATAE